MAVCVSLDHAHHFDTTVKLGARRLYVGGRRKISIKPIYPGDMPTSGSPYRNFLKSAIGNAICSSSASNKADRVAVNNI